MSRQISAGLIVGLTAVIYAMSYGTFLFSGALSPFVGFGIALALMTAAVGALFGLFSSEKSFISGPDSNTISVMASILGAVAATGLTSEHLLQVSLATLISTSLVTSAVFVAVRHFNLAGFVRYIPFPVMAGFLASTGWLMSSGALNIISGTPLSIAGIQTFATQPYRPELFFGILVAAVLLGLSRRISSVVLIPLVILVSTVLVNALFAGEFITAGRDVWLFTKHQKTALLLPWNFKMRIEDLLLVGKLLPSMLVVSFVGVLTVLLSIASLELNYRKEFDLNQVLGTHALLGCVGAATGGFVGIISIGRTELNYQMKGGRLSGAIAASLCIAVLFGADWMVSYVPKPALGGLVLYLGFNMLKQWIWNQRRTATRSEMLQILLLVALVANFGFVAGFFVGVLISCVIFIIKYSSLPLAENPTNLSLFTSAVIRPQAQVNLLRHRGTSVLIYRLKGYLFFGSASTIDHMFQDVSLMHADALVLDFTDVSGIDHSAAGIFQRILRRFEGQATQFYFVHGETNQKSVLSFTNGDTTTPNVHYFDSLDCALEAAEEMILSVDGCAYFEGDCLDFLDNQDDRQIFVDYCELRDIAHGSVLCGEGDFSDEIFFLQHGSLEVFKEQHHGSMRLAKFRKGAMAGEISFSTGDARSASVVAASNSKVWVMHRTAVMRMRTDHPKLAMQLDQMIIRRISHSLARSNHLLTILH